MGATVQSRDGSLVIRVWYQGRRWPERTTWPDTPENRTKAERYAARVAEAIKANNFGPAQYLHFFPGGLRAAEMRTALGLDVADSKQQPTFKEYAEHWLARQSVKAKRLKELKGAITRLAASEVDGVLIGSMRMRAITPAVLEIARAQWVAGGLKMKSARNYLQGSIGALFTTAVDVDRIIKVHPCQKMKWPKKFVPDPDPFTMKERDAIVGALREAPTHKRRRKGIAERWAYFLVAFLFYTGMRPSEAAGLAWGDIDLATWRAFIRRSRVYGILGPPKHEGSRRTVRLSAQAIEILRAIRPLHPDAATPIFTTPSGRPINQDRFSKIQWRTALSAAKVRPRRLYDTRCTFISLAVSRHVDLLWISRQVGSSVATLERHYARYMPDADEVQLMRLNEALTHDAGENGTVLVRDQVGGRP